LSRWAATFVEVCLAEYGEVKPDSAPPVSHLDDGSYSDPNPPRPDELIVMFEKRHFGIAPLLQRWLDAEGLPSLMAYVECLYEKPYNTGRVSRGQRHYREIAEWFTSQHVRAHFAERCLDAVTNESPDFLNQPGRMYGLTCREDLEMAFHLLA